MSSENVLSDAERVETLVAFVQVEAEHKAATIALAKKRQALPWRKIDQDYIFDGGPRQSDALPMWSPLP